MSEELKPCPFCGGEATWAKANRGWKVECEGRFGSCFMNARTHYQPTKLLALNAWNTRSDSVEPLELKNEILYEALQIARHEVKERMRNMTNFTRRLHLSEKLDAIDAALEQGRE